MPCLSPVHILNLAMFTLSRPLRPVTCVLAPSPSMPSCLHLRWPCLPALCMHLDRPVAIHDEPAARPALSEAARPASKTSPCSVSLCDSRPRRLLLFPGRVSLSAAAPFQSLCPLLSLVICLLPYSYCRILSLRLLLSVAPYCLVELCLALVARLTTQLCKLACHAFRLYATCVCVFLLPCIY